MKIKNISRDDESYTRKTNFETQRSFSDPNPDIHRFEKPREYLRALNATKIESIYAKPFLADLSGHADTPTVLAFDPNSNSHLISASSDGQIRVWDITDKKTIYAIDRAHNGFVNGIAIPPYLHASSSTENSFYFSVGTDKHLKKWELNLKVANVNPEMASTKYGSIGYTLGDDTVGKLPSYATPTQDVVAPNTLLCIDHHYSDPLIATSGYEFIHLWDCYQDRLVPKQEFELPTSTETVYSVKFNRVERHILAYCARDRSVGLYDIKSNQMIRAVTMETKSNKVCWNPMNPFHFSCANEDGNAYTYDMRILEKGPIMMHTGHTNSVLDIDYHPLGNEFVTAGYDRTVRIFKTDSTDYRSREVYHTRRMQRVFSVKYSLDGKYILSGSDDQAIRIWKTERSAPLRELSRKERSMIEYNQKLIERYKNVEDVRRIADHRHLPKALKSQTVQLMKERIGKERREKVKERYTSKKDAKIEKKQNMRKRFIKVNE
ncbi:hypothetical protein ABK040_009089 [Willaertia magna]